MRWTWVLAILLCACQSSSPPAKPDGGIIVADGGPGDGACSSLQEAACAARSDCRVNRCNNCMCAPTFIDCSDASGPMQVCSQVCPAPSSLPTCCRSDSDCSGKTCTVPSSPAGAACTADSGCPSGDSCVDGACYLGKGTCT